MPEKPLTVATYAAGASLAAITLVYVFAPTFFLDDHGASTSARRKGVVGLANAANDCFLNSVLQALAGLPDLRIYLIRETHRRRLDGPEVYAVHPARLATGPPASPARLEGLQRGLLTHGLKDMLDRLNERPLATKTISPQPFIAALEHAFGTRISRQQQDAQEFLQLVAERLCDEYHAGAHARRHALLPSLTGPLVASDDAERREIVAQFGAAPSDDAPQANEQGFPLEGRLESQIECQTCHFKPKPTGSNFVTLTLNVPQCDATSLGACFDGTFRIEYIDDFKCERCRLEHALQSKNRELSRTLDPDRQQRLQADMAKIQQALDDDPENPPEDVELPDTSQSPKRRISRHMYMSQFPNVLAVHLSRSLFALGSVSTKNLAKVSFPEALPLGGLLHRKNYRLLGLVTHKGSHNSGHYESFRRQVQPLPFSTPASFGTEGAYSQQPSPRPSAVPSVAPSAAHSPHMSATHLPPTNDPEPPIPSALDTSSMQSRSSQDSAASASRGSASTSTPHVPSDTESLHPCPSPADAEPRLRSRSIRSIRDKASEKAASVAESNPLRRTSRKTTNRWWRISDDKIKECKTSDVLGMQREVYLLFYELHPS